jgi:hypothetical protein
MHHYFCIDRRHPGPDQPGRCAGIRLTEFSVYNPGTGGLRGHIVEMRAARVDGLRYATDRRPVWSPLIIGSEVVIVGQELPTNVLAAMLIAMR